MSVKFNVIYDDKYNPVAVETESGCMVKQFISQEELEKPKFTLYVYIEVINGDLFAKFGKAIETTVWQRYNQTGCTNSKRMIAIWESDADDKPIHDKLEMRSKNKRGYIHVGKDILNTVESYLILDVDGLNNFLADISEYANATIVTKEKIKRDDYDEVVDLVEDVIHDTNEGCILNLPTRFGKTGTTLRLCKRLNEEFGYKMFMMCSYVSTVKRSYSQECDEIINNENCLFIDPDVFEDELSMKNKITDWCKDSKHYVMYYVALTGDELSSFDRRTKVAKALSKKLESVVFIEEADFGAMCWKQIKKVQSMYKTCNSKKLIAMTGTNADKCERIFNF